MDNTALINVRVPPNAEVWFDDQKTSQTGSFRSFISPPLNPDGDFVYHIRVRWTEDGRQVDKTRRIDVHAGDRLFVNLSPGQYRAPAQYGAEPEMRGEDRSLERNPKTPPPETVNRPRTPPSANPPPEKP